MIQGTDLYPILSFYANKNNSPYITVDSFLAFLERTAKKYSVGFPAWNKWLQNKEVKFWSEMSSLLEKGTCQFVSDADDSHIFMTNYYPDLVGAAYQRADDDADLPFPSEGSMGITVPSNQVIYLDAEQNILPGAADSGNPARRIAKINFPDDFGSALVPVEMIPKQLAETAILKVRNYLKRYGNREYAYHKLGVPLQGKEQFLKEQLERIIVRPMDVFTDMREGGDLSHMFWAHFCSLVKNDMKKKQDHLPVDIAAFQSFSVLEFVNGHYRAITVKRREVEMAFKSLENCLARLPYLYSMGDIIKFEDSRGKRLLGQYSSEELDEWLKNQTTGGKSGEAPSLFVMRSATVSERCYLLREKMLPYCVRLLVDARTLIHDTILKQWSRLLMDYKNEPAMESDDEFEKALYKTGLKLCPDLINILADPRLILIYQENERTNKAPSTVTLFDKGVLLPYHSLFLLRRRDILQKAKTVLPFWYSMPILFAIISFFKRRFQKRKSAKALLSKGISGEDEILEESPGGSGEIRAAALELELFIIPAGHTLQSYLDELEDRWSRIIDRKARETLVSDVRFLAKDILKQKLKLQKQFKPTREALGQIAYDLVTRNKALSTLGARDALLLYLELYMIKLLENIK